MKFLNGVPQFEEWPELGRKITFNTANQKLCEAFAERVCVKCKYYEVGECNLWECSIPFGSPQQFSCAAWVKK